MQFLCSGKPQEVSGPCAELVHVVMSEQDETFEEILTLANRFADNVHAPPSEEDCARWDVLVSEFMTL